MSQALELARRGAEQGEVPVGALVVLDGEIIGQGYNCPIWKNDPTAHAEIQAIRQAAEKIGNYRLVGSTLYVTLEPCVMCVGAIIHARIDRLVFGASEHKTGAVSSVFELLHAEQHNHRLECDGAVLADECGQLLKDFFRARRN